MNLDTSNWLERRIEGDVKPYSLTHSATPTGITIDASMLHSTCIHILVVCTAKAIS